MSGRGTRREGRRSGPAGPVMRIFWSRNYGRTYVLTFARWRSEYRECTITSASRPARSPTRQWPQRPLFGLTWGRRGSRSPDTENAQRRRRRRLGCCLASCISMGGPMRGRIARRLGPGSGVGHRRGRPSCNPPSAYWGRLTFAATVELLEARWVVARRDDRDRRRPARHVCVTLTKQGNARVELNRSQPARTRRSYDLGWSQWSDYLR